MARTDLTRGHGATERDAILDALGNWIRQRPGLEFGNYGSVSSYRSELRGITRDRRDAERLWTAVANRTESIPVGALRAAFRAFMGRLSVTTTETGQEGTGAWTAQLDYVAGQYWPTEYRAAACAVLASALWDAKRDATYNVKAPELEAKGKSYGTWIRAEFRREFGRGIQSRWMD